jgi:hypothetical protein
MFTGRHCLDDVTKPLGAEVAARQAAGLVMPFAITVLQSGRPGPEVRR